MVELFKKSMFAAIGMALMTKEKAEEFGKKVASEAKLSESEGKQFVDEFLKRVDDTRMGIEKMVAQHVDTALKKINVPTTKQIEALELRIRKLESDITQDSV